MKASEGEWLEACLLGSDRLCGGHHYMKRIEPSFTKVAHMLHINGIIISEILYKEYNKHQNQATHTVAKAMKAIPGRHARASRSTQLRVNIIILP